MKRFAIVPALLGLGACSLLSPQQQQKIGNAIVAGQLFCAESTPLGPLVVALATVSGVPISVIGKSSDEVAAACGVINAVPVVPPPVPAQAPVVTQPAQVALNGVRQR